MRAIRRVWPLSLALLAGTSWAAAAQVPDDDGAARVVGTLGISLRGSRLSESGALLAGAAAGVGFGRWAVLGVGMGLLGDVDPAATPGRSLDVGYGGVALEARIEWPGSFQTTGGLLLGGGNADLRDQVTFIELGSDNFFVIEPEVRVQRRATSWLSVGLGASYRVAGGFEGLTGLDDSDLSGPSLTLHVRYERR